MGKSKFIEISIVIPLYNESKTLPFLVERLNKLEENSDLSIEFVLIDDGSKDNTAELMGVLALSDKRYHCVFLSRNYGHQIALTSGLNVVRAKNAVMIIDGDLQDPPELLTDFYEYYKKGYDVVYAVRKKEKRI